MHRASKSPTSFELSSLPHEQLDASTHHATIVVAGSASLEAIQRLHCLLHLIRPSLFGNAVMLNRNQLRKRAVEKKLRKEQFRLRKKKRLIIEMLEQRMVLASDFQFDATAEQRPAFQMTLASDGSNLLLIDSNDGTILKSQSIQHNSGRVAITGSNRADSLTIDQSLPSAISVLFIGGDGIDSLNGPSRDSEWKVTGNNLGVLNESIQFSGVENLLGATDNRGHVPIR